MGGFTSGNYAGAKRTVEECVSLSVFDLNRWGLLGVRRPLCIMRYEGRGWSGRFGLEVWPNRVEVRYRAEDRISGDSRPFTYAIRLTTTPCHFGGKRYWFLCPNVNCGRRVAKLYLPLQTPVFCCRHCHDLAYTSQQEDRASLLLLKAQNIRTRLGGRPGFQDPFPPKPNGMHWETYNRLREEAEEAEKVGRFLQYRSMKQALRIFDRLAPAPDSD